MPPRYAYWTIIAGGLPTAFRSATLEDLLPTFQRIRERHPDATMKWFARGKLWDSPEDAQVRRDDSRGHRPPGRNASKGPDRRSEEKRGRDWRPGGEHRDPRQKFVDAQKAKNAARRQERWQRKAEPTRGNRPTSRTPSRPPSTPSRPSPPRPPSTPSRPPPPRPPSTPSRPPAPRRPSAPPRRPSMPSRRPPRGPRR